MVHVTEDTVIRQRLIAHRGRVQHLIERLDQDMDCSELLAEVVSSYRALGDLCSELAVEHLREHVAEVEDAQRRTEGAQQLEAVLRAAYR
jgi:DNA-binding FrmR family transcriptional regulator